MAGAIVWLSGGGCYKSIIIIEYIFIIQQQIITQYLSFYIDFLLPLSTSTFYFRFLLQLSTSTFYHNPFTVSVKLLFVYTHPQSELCRVHKLIRL